MNKPPYSTSPLLDQYKCIQHGFFGREGGVSTGVYAGLNCGYTSNDDPSSIDRNRQRVASCFGLNVNNLYSLQQAHTIKVVKISADTAPQFETIADGMVSREQGIALCVLGADCAPVLFVDPVNRVIGAAHSGWRGALDGINESIIRSMIGLGAKLSNLHAAIGPAMQQSNYEVQADFIARFEARSPIDASAFFTEVGAHSYFNTPAYIRERLRVAGVTEIGVSSVDTYSHPDRYFSYRRTCQQGDQDYGRQVSLVTLV